MNIAKINNVQFGLKFSNDTRDFFTREIKKQKPLTVDLFVQNIRDISEISTKNDNDVIELLKTDKDNILTLKLHDKENRYSYLQLLMLKIGENLSIKDLLDIKDIIKAVN